MYTMKAAELTNSKGRPPTEAEEEQFFDKCTFTSADGRKLGQNLECLVHDQATELGIGARCGLAGGAQCVLAVPAWHVAATADV